MSFLAVGLNVMAGQETQGEPFHAPLVPDSEKSIEVLEKELSEVRSQEKPTSDQIDNLKRQIYNDIKRKHGWRENYDELLGFTDYPEEAGKADETLDANEQVILLQKKLRGIIAKGRALREILESKRALINPAPNATPDDSNNTDQSKAPDDNSDETDQGNSNNTTSSPNMMRLCAIIALPSIILSVVAIYGLIKWYKNREKQQPVSKIF